MLLRLLPLLTGFVPIIAAHVSYLIAIRAGVLVACMPVACLVGLPEKM